MAFKDLPEQSKVLVEGAAGIAANVSSTLLGKALIILSGRMAAIVKVPTTAVAIAVVFAVVVVVIGQDSASLLEQP